MCLCADVSVGGFSGDNTVSIIVCDVVGDCALLICFSRCYLFLKNHFPIFAHLHIAVAESYQQEMVQEKALRTRAAMQSAATQVHSERATAREVVVQGRGRPSLGRWHCDNRIFQQRPKTYA